MKRNDWIMIAVFLFAAAGIYAVINIFGIGRGAYVEVMKDGKAIAQFSLDEDIQYTIGDDEDYNILIIKDGKAAITDASCPEKSCTHQRTIDSSGGSIICVPNKVVIEVVSDIEADSDIDGIVY